MGMQRWGADGPHIRKKRLPVYLVKFRQMAGQKPRPFEETELDVISIAQAVTCADEDDAVTSKTPGRLLQLKLSPIAEHEHEPSQAWHHTTTTATTVTNTATNTTTATTTATRQPTDSSYSLCSVDKYSSSRLSSTAESYTTLPPDTGDDCAGVVLACLFCRFYDLCLMLPNSCDWAAQRLCPSYQHFAKTREAGHSGGNGDCNCKCDFDCGLFDACHESGECLELAMEISEVCYH
ncbi:myoD family inhibitor domain-containing protein 2 [Alosa sapidissima]|uniref:myoD family inhibitor domain-containing protein 2 n=1 Tax=Alosa sapidissima TaxID=34773 RepID=UPI001C092F1D|nr:myoD family inhibitor domain-containing protein 2 [Alosa sapidissima]